MNSIKYTWLLFAVMLLSSCKYNVDKTWKYSTGDFHLGDVIEFKSGKYTYDKDKYIYLEGKKAAKIVDFKMKGFREEMIIESLDDPDKKGYYVELKH